MWLGDIDKPDKTAGKMKRRYKNTGEINTNHTIDYLNLVTDNVLSYIMEVGGSVISEFISECIASF